MLVKKDWVNFISFAVRSLLARAVNYHDGVAPQGKQIGQHSQPPQIWCLLRKA